MDKGIIIKDSRKACTSDEAASDLAVVCTGRKRCITKQCQTLKGKDHDDFLVPQHALFCKYAREFAGTICWVKSCLNEK